MPADAAGAPCGRRLALGAQSLFSLGQTKPAQSHLEAAHALAAELGDKGRQAKVLSSIALHHWIGGELTLAIRSETAALGIARDRGYRGQELASTARLGLIMVNNGDYTAARDVLTRAYDQLSADEHERHGQLGSPAVAILSSLSICLGELGACAAEKSARRS